MNEKGLYKMKDIIFTIIFLTVLYLLSNLFNQQDDSDNTDNGARYEDGHMRGVRE